MNDAGTLTTFLGWCTVINMVLLCLSTLALALMKDWVAAIHSRMFGIDRAGLPALYFQYLGNFKVFIIVFNFAPWMALELMG